MIPPADVGDLLATLPLGTSRGTAHGKAYLATRSLFSAGKSAKLVAEALDGSDYVSLNYYDLITGPRLFPCEMPAAKVIAFLRSYQPEPSP